MKIEDSKIVKIDRTSPMSMEYYVQVIDIFGARPMYHFEKKKDAIELAEALKNMIVSHFHKATKEDQSKAIKLLSEYDYSDVSKKREMFIDYI